MNTTEINKTTKTDIFKVDPRLVIIEESFNTRIDYGNIEELAKSIKENGLMIPIRVYRQDENFVIIDGHRRLKAIQMLLNAGVDIPRIAAIVTRKQTAEERVFQILLTNSGKPLSPIELGETYKRLLNFGYSTKEIANRIGKSENSITENIDLVTNTTKVTKQLITDKRISANLAKKIIKNSPSADEANEEVLKVVEFAETEGRKVKPSDVIVTTTVTNKMYSKDDVREVLKKFSNNLLNDMMLAPSSSEKVQKIIETLEF